MIFDGKKMVPRKLVLAALAAARRSGRRGPHAPARMPWMPLALRWKKRPAAPNMVQTVNHFASLTRIASFSQFHFYLDQFLINRGIVSAHSIDTGRHTGYLARRVNGHSPAQLVRAKQRSGRRISPGRAVSRPESIFKRGERTVREELLTKREASIETSGIVRKFLTRKTDLFHGVSARRLRQLAEGSAATTPAYSRQTPERLFAAPSPKRSVYAASPAAGARTRRANEASKTPGPGFESVFGRRDELVWRRPASTAVMDEERSNPRQNADARIDTVRQNALQTTAARAFSSLSGQGKAGFTVANLDRTMVDRLTNEVIRQVEKRARIERERRGIM